MCYSSALVDGKTSIVFPRTRALVACADMNVRVLGLF